MRRFEIAFPNFAGRYAHLSRRVFVSRQRDFGMTG
jgi:hypothetical protein